MTLRWPWAPWREALLAAVLASSLAAVLLWLGPPGNDLAAHLYQRTLFLKHGFVLWNNFWYAGRYSFVTYSVLYYPLSALLGIRVLGLASVTAAALAFAIVVGREWGPVARWSSRTFAVVWAGTVLSAAFPFALGTALALLALWALQERRRGRFATLVLLTLLASPLAFALLDQHRRVFRELSQEAEQRNRERARVDCSTALLFQEKRDAKGAPLGLGERADRVRGFGKEIAERREREARLRLGGTRGEHTEPALSPTVDPEAPELRLPDSRLAFEQERTRRRRRGVEERFELLALPVAAQETGDEPGARCHASGIVIGDGGRRNPRYDRDVAEQQDKPLSEQLEEIGSRLAWVRDYL